MQTHAKVKFLSAFHIIQTTVAHGSNKFVIKVLHVISYIKTYQTERKKENDGYNENIVGT